MPCGIGTVEDGELHINLTDLADALSPKARLELIRHLCADERLFSAVLEAVVDGEYHQDDEDGGWWFGDEATLKLRQQLLPLMPKVAAEAVKKLVHDRKAAEETADRLKRWAWRMYNAWPLEYMDRPELEGWEPTGYISDEKAAAIVSGEEE